MRRLPPGDEPLMVLDTGALIALERTDPVMIKLLSRARVGETRFILPDAVLAQVWRGGSGKQARLATLLRLDPARCLRVAMDTSAAKDIGVLIAASGHTDVVDVHVALLTSRYGAGVVTSDRADILAVDPSLADQIIDI